MNLTNRKLLVVFAFVFLLATILGGWFVSRDKKTPEGNQNKPVAGENTTKNPEENTSKNPPVSKSPETIRNEKIISLLASENGELESGVHLSFSMKTEHHVRGRAFLDSDSRKKVFFLATNVFYDSSLSPEMKQELKYGEWNVFDGFKESFSCQLMRDYRFPKNMMTGCVENTEKIGDGVAVSRYWKLMSGDPKDSCTRPLYEGNVVVRGWYEWDTNYVAKDWMLFVNKTDERKLFTGFPWPLSFKLNNVSPELEEELKSATPEKPVLLTVKKLGYYCEGSPWLEL